MWLIHTESLKLECFLGKDIPKYAILSHTWGDEEVTFQDWKDLEKVSQKRGLIKIKSACAQAERDGLSYLWVDTTCIDKSSSAELSEAINSMFSWYKYSEICYVYLVDVEDPDDVSGKLLYESEERDAENHKLDMATGEYLDDKYPIDGIKGAKFMDSFRNSRWFTRGWTLQELLAPRFLQFFTQDWKPIIVHPHDMVWPTASRRHQHHLLQLLSDITSIRVHALFGSDYAMRCSSGEKFSWMAGRETTREEDMAYCLIGIFDINMPLLYGEGSKAFGRLQEEIAKQSTDHSLFAWEWPQSDSPRSGRLPDLFAGSIEHFSNLNPKLVGYSLEPNDDVDEDEEYNPLASLLSLTNFGLSINLALIPTADPNRVFGVLNVAKDRVRGSQVSDDQDSWCIPLQKNGRVYRRARFPPGPFPVRTRRQRPIYQIYIPRDKFYFEGNDYGYKYEYAFIILFPELKIGAGFRLEPLGDTGGADCYPHRSTVFIRPGALKKGPMATSLLSVTSSETSVVLYIAAREVNDRIETAVKLFAAGTSVGGVENARMDFRPPSVYWDRCGSFSLAVREGHHVNPLPGESGSRTIFSVSLYTDLDFVQPENESVQGIESQIGGTVDRESDANFDEASDRHGNNLATYPLRESKEIISPLRYTPKQSPKNLNGRSNKDNLSDEYLCDKDSGDRYELYNKDKKKFSSDEYLSDDETSSDYDKSDDGIGGMEYELPKKPLKGILKPKSIGLVILDKDKIDDVGIAQHEYIQGDFPVYPLRKRALNFNLNPEIIGTHDKTMKSARSRSDSATSDSLWSWSSLSSSLADSNSSVQEYTDTVQSRLFYIYQVLGFQRSFFTNTSQAIFYFFGLQTRAWFIPVLITAAITLLTTYSLQNALPNPAPRIGDSNFYTTISQSIITCCSLYYLIIPFLRCGEKLPVRMLFYVCWLLALFSVVMAPLFYESRWITSVWLEFGGAISQAAATAFLFEHVKWRGDNTNGVDD